MDRNPDIKTLRRRIALRKEAAKSLLDKDSAREARWAEWEDALIHASWRCIGNEKAYYSLRFIAITAGIIVPSLVGLNLAGAGGVVVRWVTFSLSLVAALTTGWFTLFRTGDRWLMYRRLRDELTAIGDTLLDNVATGTQTSDAQAANGAWKTFTTATDQAMVEFNKTYEATVIQQSGSTKSAKG